MDYYHQEDYQEAVEEFHLDVHYNPNHSLGHYYLAKSLLAEGQPRLASMAFKNAHDAEMRSPMPDKSFAAKCRVEEQAALHQ